MLRDNTHMISAAILAGGYSSRFGGIIKPNIVVGGEKIISRIICTIKDFFSEIIIVTNNPEEFSDFESYKLVKDIYLKSGPLGGIHAGMKTSSGEAVFVFAGDMPFLNRKIIEDLINGYTSLDHEIIVPKVGSLIEPLHAIYKVSLILKLEKFLSKGTNRSVRDFVAARDAFYCEFPADEVSRLAFTNINNQADIDRIQPFPGNNLD
ncbi:MAG: molybdenum cofactor guanylyltransferase [Bacteroidota bacterium]|nr:molybdenum cofactor guanylyltransferase [Bacteroidota bacterium]